MALAGDASTRQALGIRLGRYRQVRELGRGTSAVVDLVFDATTDTYVALKRMQQVTADARFRLKQEFRRARDVHHPNLVRLYDLVADESDVFFTMEAVMGRDLHVSFVERRERLAGDDEAKQTDVVQTLQQLTEAVCALHDAGVVHRDLKPTNVLIEDGGRLVLLDFGFSSPLAKSYDHSDHGTIVGTVPYMAPERLWGAAPTAESDWYSVGVIAAELLLEVPFFSGSIQATLEAKDRPPLTLRNRLPFLHPSLDALISGLLRRDPSARPQAAQIHAVLAEIGGHSQPQSFWRVRGNVFVGRTEELDLLEHWLSPDPRPQIARVWGKSGIGKSAMVREFVRRVSERDGWVVFRGRCHPKEHLPLKALDAVVDDMSHYLRTAGQRQRAKLTALPGLAALTKLFPVLQRVPELSNPTDDAADPQARSIEAVQGFRGLLHLLAGFERVMVWIDDFQWADRDGLKLLTDAMSAEPRPPVAWLFSYRPDKTQGNNLAAATLARLVRTISDGALDLPLSGLCEPEALELCAVLGGDAAVAQSIVAESGGSPFILYELTRQVASTGLFETMSIEALIERRLAALEAADLLALEFLALAEGPLPLDSLEQLLAPAESPQRHIEQLEQALLLRVSYRGDEDVQVAEIYHDRIREALAARIDPETKKRRHAQMAAVLANRSGVSRCTIAFHYRSAGDVEQGVSFTIEAAEECIGVLAFEEAAELFLAAFDLSPLPRTHVLLERAAEALAQAGRCAESGERFHQASLGFDAEGREAHARNMKLRAGAEFLNGGRIGEGRRALHDVLESHGLQWPRWPVISAMSSRAKLLLRGVPPIPLLSGLERGDAHHCARFDALWAAAKGTVMVEHLAGDALALRALHEAIKARDPRRIIWALGHEATSEANIGGALHRRVRPLLDEVARLAGATGAYYDLAWSHQCHGIAAWFQGRWADAEYDLRTALAIFRQRCSGVAYETNVTALFLAATLESRGNIRELSTLLPDLRARASRVGDRYSSIVFRTGSLVIASLAEDRPAEALDGMNAAIAQWPLERFTSQHFQHFIGAMYAHLYAGDTRAAWAQVEASWPSLKSAYFLRLDGIGILLRHLRARAAVLAALDGGARADEFLSVAAQEAKTIRRSTLPHAAPQASSIEAAIAAVRGEHERAVDLCEGALAGFDRAGMCLYREIARSRLSRLAIAETARHRHAEESSAWLEAAGIRNVPSMARMIMPFPDLTSSRAQSP